MFLEEAGCSDVNGEAILYIDDLTGQIIPWCQILRAYLSMPRLLQACKS